MRYILLLLCLFSLSCSNEKVLQLPEIQNAKITEVLDVSPAYIFYDETQPDSTEFNRKNLISTTNWLVNVDKRLTLKQVLPHLQYLQNKRRKASMHKNENAKNYFTCNDTSIKNLGFLEFTDVDYKLKDVDFDLYISTKKDSIHYQINVVSKSEIVLKLISTEVLTIVTTIESFEEKLKSELKKYPISTNAIFSKNLTFQDYITLKSKLAKLKSLSLTIDDNEFFY
ncbi:hypothetical protein [Winogradskyella jejuensis]|uniref:Lipoprotein n=1 Tax=Winogradskyella jejuensis TaxID=1089305 RepID=A0A1M5RZ08_9FLAO|nr:hypothetical protein [Winogradskyella jejuensis]SHH31486.1 hypothetical protein SAMN05444148_1727 [Winogradskyella jejuensis]